MKWGRQVARLALICLAAALFIGVTETYVAFTPPPVVNSRLPPRRIDRPSEPQISRLPAFIGEGLGIALLVAVGRIVFRLRLSSGSRSDERLTSLSLRRANPDS
jgi:hypothetical protein